MTFTQWFLFIILVQIVHFLGTWKLYIKAGRKGWEAAIPIYNAVILMKIINRPWWWTLLLFIPIINLIMFPVIWVETIRSFGRHSTWETILVILTGGLYIFYLNYVADVTYIEDRSLKPRTAAGEWISSVLFAVIAATLVHTYLIQPFTIPTSSLEKTLLVGDFLFVSKFHYGARTPLTAVAFPMVHDTIPVLNVKSYLEKPQIPYFRLPGFQDIERNDIVVFNWPVDTMKNMYYTDKYYYKPIDKKTNYVKRAVGVPGDTLQIIDGKIHIDSQPLKLPERAKPQFSYEGTTKGQAFDYNYLYERYDITDPYGYNPNNNTFRINLTEEAFEKFKNHPNVASIQRVIDSVGVESDIFPKSQDISWNRDNLGPIYIPEKDATVSITQKSLPFYKRIIEVYEGSEMGIENKISQNGTQILLNGSPMESYTFKQDYYWMMGDNRHNSLDSRYFGYVPEDHVVGKPVFIWMSWDANGKGFFDKIRWERMFTTVSGGGTPISYLPYFLIVVVILIAFNYFKKRRES